MIKLFTLMLGAFRKGKSFLLNFMLRYLESGGADDWLGPEGTDLRGFHWRLVTPELIVELYNNSANIATLLTDCRTIKY